MPAALAAHAAGVHRTSEPRMQAVREELPSTPRSVKKRKRERMESAPVQTLRLAKVTSSEVLASRPPVRHFESLAVVPANQDLPDRLASRIELICDRLVEHVCAIKFDDLRF